MMNERIDQELEALKVPPNSVEAEQAVLGGLMLDNTAYDKIADAVSPGDFYRFDHRIVFECIASLVSEGRPADVVTVFQALQNSGKAEEIGGLVYLNTLVENTPSAANIRHYADIVRSRAVLRQLISVSNDIAETAFKPGGRDVRQILDEAEGRIFAIAEAGNRASDGFQPIQPILEEVVSYIDELYNREGGGDVTGLATGFLDLDRMTSGLQPGNLVIVAGRPSMGKTAFSMNIAEHVAVNQKLPVAVFSMEMGGSELAMRMLGSVGRLDQHRLKTGRLEEEDWERVTWALSQMHDTPLYIDATPALSVAEVRARSRRLARECGGKLGLVVIDYLQLMVSSNPGENRATEISEISRGLKALAKELSCPVIALSQLNRSVEQRPNKRPVMSDLRESGAIEQDADLILFIYRDEVYNPESADKGTAEIIIGKQRNGPIGQVRLAFVGRHTKFENYVQDAGNPYG